MSDKPEIRNLIRRTEAEAERIRQASIGKMFLNICVMGAQALIVLKSIDSRISNIETFVKNAIITKLVPIKSDTVILVVQSQTINADSHILVVKSNTITSNAEVT